MTMTPTRDDVLRLTRQFIAPLSEQGFYSSLEAHTAHGALMDTLSAHVSRPLILGELYYQRLIAEGWYPSEATALRDELLAEVAFDPARVRRMFDMAASEQEERAAEYRFCEIPASSSHERMFGKGREEE